MDNQAELCQSAIELDVEDPCECIAGGKPVIIVVGAESCVHMGCQTARCKEYLHTLEMYNDECK